LTRDPPIFGYVLWTNGSQSSQVFFFFGASCPQHPPLVYTSFLFLDVFYQCHQPITFFFCRDLCPMIPPPSNTFLPQTFPLCSELSHGLYFFVFSCSRSPPPFTLVSCHSHHLIPQTVPQPCCRFFSFPTPFTLLSPPNIILIFFLSPICFCLP